MFLEWRYEPGTYLYLHPYWYRFDEQSKVSLVGKGNIKLSSPYGAKVSTTDVLLDLETLIDSSIDEHFRIQGVQLSTLMIITLNPAEPEGAWHPRDYVTLGPWLYRADKRLVLHAIGQVPAIEHDRRINQCLELIKYDDPTLTDGNLYIAEDDQWTLRDQDQEPYETIDALTYQSICDVLLEAVQREMKKKSGLPPGHRVEVTSDDGYVAKALIMHTDMPSDPRKGKPFGMTVSVRDKDGRQVKPDDGQMMSTAYTSRHNVKQVTTEEELDRFYHSLTDEQQRAFMQDCERLFGPPPAVRTHD